MNLILPIINPKFSLKFSKFYPNISKMLFKIIYFEFPINFIWDLFKIFATFIPESFQEISTNFSKNLVKISIKFYLRIAQILVIVYQKFPKYFLFFVKFPQISIKISSYFSIFTISQSNFSKIFWKIFVTVFQIFCKILSSFS